MITDMIIAKNGDILFSTLASAIAMWSIAQKLRITPIVPYTDLLIRSGQLSLRMWNFSGVRERITIANTAAIAFLKKAFSIVGRSPAILTNSDISEKKKADAIMNNIPLVLLFRLTMHVSYHRSAAH